jgi:hypothetical protein
VGETDHLFGFAQKGLAVFEAGFGGDAGGDVDEEGADAWISMRRSRPLASM